MKTTLLAAVFLTVARPAFADAADDYVACLIGRSAIALGRQERTKDAAKAQEVAYGQCAEPKDYGDAEPDGVVDFANMAVENMAKGDWL